MRNVCIKALTLALAVIGFLAATPRSEAQLVQTLMQFTNQWRYLQTGTEQGTAWRAISFPAESTWPQGRGILGFETDAIAAYAVHAPTLTPLTISQSITTYYFRTTFNFSGSTNGVTLIATNLVDDGCAIYLNGVLAANPLRLPASYNAASLATGGPAPEGVLEPLTLNGLRTGANTIAVEVHQSSATSSDVMFGIKLVSISPQTLLITNQPQSQTVSAGDPVTFSVGVSGGPAFYRWQKDGVNLSSTSNTLTIANPQLANAGSYRVFVTNILSSLVSDIAVLTVIADSDGPKITAAIIDNGLGSNSVNVRFDEVANSVSARNTNNYRLVPVSNTNVTVVVTNIVYSSALGARLDVSTTDVNWNPRGQYFLVINGVSDLKGNNIAPYTRVPVSVQITTNLTQISDRWDYWDSYFVTFDIGIYTNKVNPWYGTNYTVNNEWGSGYGILYADPSIGPSTCSGDILGTPITWQDVPTLFRRTFVMPAGFGTNGQFRLRYFVDDGMVVYLNGVEIHRYNMPTGPLTYTSKALSQVPPTCITNVTVPVTGLKAGTNVLAAEIYQVTDNTETDTAFGLEMDGVFLSTPIMPIQEPPANQLKLTYSYSKLTRALVMSWPTNFSGYSLVAKPAIGTNGANPEWTQVSDQTNPYTNAIPTSANRFFEVKKL